MAAHSRGIEAYVLAVGVTIALTAVRLSLIPIIELPPFILFFPALVVSGWWGGVGPAFASLAVCVLASWVYLFEPVSQLRIVGPDDIATLALFAAVGGVVAFLAGSFRSAHAHVDAERRRLRSYLNATSDGVIVLDRQWRCTFVNPPAAVLLRRPAAELLGRTFQTFVTDAETSPVTYEAERTMRDRNPRQIEHYDAVRDNWLDHEIHPIGEGITIFFRDVTARHRDASAQAALLHREQVARKHSEEASRLKDEFVATVSHELRTPLNAILGWARLLQQSDSPQLTLDRGLDAIERNASAQAQLIEDLLDVARITTGKLRLDIAPVVLPEVIDAAVETIRPTAEAKSIQLAVALEADAAVVSGDPDRLQQVAWNLLSNAVKFTPRGGRVHVRLQRADSHVVLSVSDTGIGIDQNLLPHLFERFRQAETGSARRHSGLGLGLALVRHLVELHGGTASAESPGPGGGATFTVTLPLLVPEESAASSRQPEMEGEPFTGWALPSLGGLPILVVDDCEDARVLLAEILERQGAIVSLASSAPEALDVLERASPLVVLSDIEMPGRDGYWLVRRLREHPDPRYHELPAIAITAYARAQDRTRALLAGFHHHVAKPIDPAELVALVARAVHGRQHV